jgi:hypothetical protein
VFKAASQSRPSGAFVFPLPIRADERSKGDPGKRELQDRCPGVLGLKGKEANESARRRK